MMAFYLLIIIYFYIKILTRLVIETITNKNILSKNILNLEKKVV